MLLWLCLHLLQCILSFLLSITFLSIGFLHNIHETEETFLKPSISLKQGPTWCCSDLELAKPQHLGWAESKAAQTNYTMQLGFYGCSCSSHRVMVKCAMTFFPEGDCYAFCLPPLVSRPLPCQQSALSEIPISCPIKGLNQSNTPTVTLFLVTHDRHISTAGPQPAHYSSQGNCSFKG